jgi:CarboxypepD_reg-like domain
MKKSILLSIIVLLSIISTQSFAQQTTSNTPNIYRDSVVQLFGVVMTADSLKAIPFASVVVNKKGRGTITNNDGVFSIAVNKGEKIIFTCVGFKDRVITIPTNLEGNQYSVIQLMVNDTNFLPATILKPRPTRAQFERDFVNAKVDDDLYETAKKNTSDAQKRIILASLPRDGKEAVGASLTNQAAKYYYSGQLPPMNILNPAAWKSFINSWKRGDFKSKN